MSWVCCVYGFERRLHVLRLLLHVVAAASVVHWCSARRVLQDVVPPTPPWTGEVYPSAGVGVSGPEGLEELIALPFRKYFYTHNETLIATAIAIAQAKSNDAPGRGTVAERRKPGSFPDLRGPRAPDGNESSERSLVWDLEPWGVEMYEQDIASVMILAMDSCVWRADVFFRNQRVKVSSELWRPHIDLGAGGARRPFFKVAVLVRLVTGVEILGEGVYYPATGTMQLVGCSSVGDIMGLRENSWRYPDPYLWNHAFSNSTASGPEVEMVPPIPATNPYPESRGDVLSTEGLVCAMDLTLEYPRQDARWNFQRKLKFSLRSTRGVDDALYFAPMERAFVYPYESGRRRFGEALQVEAGARVLVLLLGLVFVAAQIRHGRRNEESLPFVSLAMVSIQIANHVSQTSVLKDLQIGRYRHLLDSLAPTTPPSAAVWDQPPSPLLFSDMNAAFENQIAMTWYEHVPYQAMAMTAIFMYGWIFYRVGARRRTMRRRRPGAAATDPPSDAGVALATVVSFFAMVGVLALCTESLPPGHVYHRMRHGVSVPPSLYEMSQEQWALVNKVTGLAVSLFLLPQLLGNWLWDVRGRPLSTWFYVGLPFLQSLPQGFTVAKHFGLLPIFDWFDPYENSLHGFYSNPSPWLPMGTMLATGMLVLAVHLQFAKPSRLHSSAKPFHV